MSAATMKEMRKCAAELSMEQTAAAIASHEAGEARFVTSVLVIDPAKKWNKFEFDVLGPGEELPGPLLIAARDAPAPAGHTQQWAGMMFVMGKAMDITLWRKN